MVEPGSLAAGRSFWFPPHSESKGEVEMAAEVEAQFSIGQVIPGTPYRVRRLIGSGGMGTVYEVEHDELGKLFVLKALRAQLVERRDLAARMKNEWRALGRLEHPNIVVVTDAGRTSKGVPFYVMERLVGETLAARLRRDGPMNVPSSIRVAVAILDALAAAHAIGVVHRDIKPQNVFLPSGGGLKLLDFGVAKLRDQAAIVVTRRGVAIGTPKYMSPEQAEGNAVDGRTDVYAVGLVLFELVAGRGPFAHHREPNDLVLAQIGETPPRLDGVRPEVPAEIADLVQRWLSKDPADRPLDAGVAARELRRILEKLGPDAAPSAEASTLEADYEATTRGPDHSSEQGAMSAATRTIQQRPSPGAAATGADPSDVTQVEGRSDTPPPAIPRIRRHLVPLSWLQWTALAGGAGLLTVGALLVGLVDEGSRGRDVATMPIVAGPEPQQKVPQPAGSSGSLRALHSALGESAALLESAAQHPTMQAAELVGPPHGDSRAAAPVIGESKATGVPSRSAPGRAAPTRPSGPDRGASVTGTSATGTALAKTALDPADPTGPSGRADPLATEPPLTELAQPSAREPVSAAAPSRSPFPAGELPDSGL